jgi:hypothetical protein
MYLAGIPSPYFNGTRQYLNLLFMRWEISMLPVNDYTAEELFQELIPEKHLLNAAGEIILAQASSDTERLVSQLIEFLFQTKETPREVYRDAENYILDLSPMKDRLITFNHLESLYQNWLQVTGRENNMDEYGMLLDFIGFGRTENRRYLVMIVSQRP